MSKVENRNYVCVNCGKSVKTLYKQYGPSVLKLCDCEYCGKVADKYLEYDRIILLIDLLLFSKEAYRHVLYNTNYKGHYKLALLQLIVILFDECIYNQNSVNIKESDSFYELTIYLVTLATVVGKSLFFFTILLFLNFYNKCNLKNLLSKPQIIKILEGLVCSSVGHFFLLTVLIWDDFQREIHLIFINSYVILSQVQSLTVTTQVPRALLGGMCVFAAAVDRLVSLYLITSLRP